MLGCLGFPPGFDMIQHLPPGQHDPSHPHLCLFSQDLKLVYSGPMLMASLLVHPTPGPKQGMEWAAGDWPQVYDGNWGPDTET